MSRIHGSGGSSKSSSSSPNTPPQEAANTLQSTSTARLMDAISEGVIGGLVNGLQSIYLNDTPIQNPDGSYNFQGINTDIRLGLPNQASMPGFPFVENEVSVGVEVKYGAPVVRTIINPDLDAIRIKMSVPGLTSTAPNGQIRDAVAPFKFEIQSSGGSYKLSLNNYAWVSMATNTTGSLATGIQVLLNKTLSGLSGTVQTTTLAASYRLVGSTPWITIDSRIISDTIPVGAYFGSGSILVSTTLEVDNLTPGSYEFRVDQGVLFGQNQFIPVDTVIAGKTTSPYQAAYRVVLPSGGAPWNVKITRTSPESSTIATQNAVTWATYTELIDAKLIYPNTAYIGLTVDARLFAQSVPTRAYDIYGIQIQIPSNYNPITRVYTGIWNGTFTTAYSNNPAWVLYDLLTNVRYGLGLNITAASVDKFSLYNIGQYCDEIIPDGFGGTEPRFCFNGVLNSQRDALSVVNALCSVFRGMAYWASGSITAVADGPTDPVKLVTPANVIEGMFTYSGSSLTARHTAALVTWNDPLDSYKAAIEVVEDPDGIWQFGWRQVDTIAVGCTSRGQAHRFGKWILDSEKHETETVVYKAGMDHYDVRPGDIVKVADPAYSNIQYGGRLKITAASLSGALLNEDGSNLLNEDGTRLLLDGATNLNTVLLDRPVLINIGDVLTISIVLPDGTITDKLIVNPPGLYTVIFLDSSLSTTPIAGAMWVISSANVNPRLFRVIAVKETDKHEWEVTALLHDPTKYARIEQNISLSLSSYSSFPTGPIQAPLNLAMKTYLYQAASAILSGVTLSWTAPKDSRIMNYEVFYQGPGANTYTYFGSTGGTSVDITGLPLGLYNFKVTALANSGIKSTPVILLYDLLGLAAPPSDVTNFGISVLGDAAYLSWNAVPDLDLDYYVVKFSPALGGATWGSSLAVSSNISKSASSITVPALIGTYLIKAVDTSGIESVNEAIIETTVAGLANFNSVATITDSTAFTGTKTNCTFSAGTLAMTSASMTVPGLYYFNGSGGATGSSYDLLAVYTSRLTAIINAFGSDLLNNVDLWPNIDNIENWDGADPSKWHINLQIRTTQTDPATSPVWTDWADFVVGDYTARAFQFRCYLVTYQAGITPVLTGLSVKIEMPDRVVGANSLTSLAGGSTITFTPAFRSTPAIGISGQGLLSGDRFLVTGQSASGFTVQFFNAAGTGVARVYDYIAKGFGKAS
jgi:predicted phage tail protein